MNGSDEQMDRLLDQYLHTSSDTPCLSEEEFWDLHESNVTDSDRDRLCDHIANCARCAEEFRLLEDFMEDPEPMSRRELDRQWRALRRRRGQDDRVTLEERLRAWFASLAGWFPGFALGTVAGIGLMLLLPADGPSSLIQVNPVPAELYPAKVTLQSGGASEAATIRFGTAQSAVLLLRTNYLQLPENPVGRIEIRNLDGAILHSIGGLHLQSPGFFALTIGRDALSGGSYEIVLHVSGDPSPVATYRVSIDQTGS